MIDKIEDTYAEFFDGYYIRAIITDKYEEILKEAVSSATATPSMVIGRLENGFEKWLDEDQTPDRRKGAIIQFWKGLDKEKSLDTLRRLEKEFSYRVRQDFIVKPSTAVFDASVKSEGKIDLMESIGRPCGNGAEHEEYIYGRSMLVIPTMFPDFRIERRMNYAKGLCGINFIYMCKTDDATIEAGKKALDTIHKVDGVVAPFNICAAGSASNGASNLQYCPSLTYRKDTKVPKEAKYTSEIVINGISMKAVKKAMKVGIEAALSVDGVVKISAGNYGGKLGDHKIYLRELFS